MAAPSPLLRSLLLVPALAGLLLLPGCALPGPGEGSGGGGSRTVLTAEEVEMGSARDVYDVIQRHRSLWLRGRGTLGPPLIYLNGQRRGGVETLRDIPAGDFFRAELLSPSEATSLYGTGHAAGVITVETRRR